MVLLRNSRILTAIAYVVAFSLLAEGAPLRGSHRQLSSPLEITPQRRLMEHDIEPDDEDFLTPPLQITPAPSASPSAPIILNADTVVPDMAETLIPTNTTDEEEEDDDEPTDETEAPVRPNNVRSLRAFSIRVEGTLTDENIFRRDLELFLLTSMKDQIPSLLNIILEPAELSFGQRRLRSLQQATALGYEGDAILLVDGDAAEETLPTTDEIREAQLNSMLRRSEGSIQSYINQFSSQPVNLLQLQIAGFQPVELLGSGVDRAVQSPDEGSDINLGLAIGIPVGIAVALCLLAGCIFWQNFVKPPPPPPYDPDESSEKGKSVNDEINGKAKKPAGTPSTVDSEAALAANKAVHYSGDVGNDAPGFVPSKTAPKNNSIALRQPAKHARGIESVDVEQQIPEDDSTFGGMSEVRTVQSNDDDSMAGYSLYTDGPEPETLVKNPADKKQSLIESIIKERAAARASQSSSGVRNAAQDRWISPQSRTDSRQDPSARLGAVSNPLYDPKMGEEVDSVFVDDDEDEVEVISHASASYRGGGGSMISAASNSVLNGGMPTRSRDNDDSVNRLYGGPDLKPNRSYGSSSSRGRVVAPPAPDFSHNQFAHPDDVSDVPSDERNNNPSIEQDLNGFTKIANNIQNGLGGIADTRNSESVRSNLMPPEDGSWEDNPEMMEAWLRERRRVKRQAKNRHQDQSQSQVTMEV